MKSHETTWILLRGLGREKAHWGSFLEQFKAAFPEEEVLALDLPGTGEFSQMRSPLSLEETCLFVRAQAIERARSQSLFKVVALSLGGMVAMQWMKTKPEDLSGCVLINTSAKKFSPFYDRLRWQVWPVFLKILAERSVRERERLLVELLINSPEAQAKALPLWIKIANERTVSYVNTFNQLVAASRYSGLENSTNVPVLLLNGLGDRFVDPSCSFKLHDKWKWPIEKHPWGGHDLPWDDPDWVIEKIKAWRSL